MARKFTITAQSHPHLYAMLQAVDADNGSTTPATIVVPATYVSVDGHNSLQWFARQAENALRKVRPAYGQALAYGDTELRAWVLNRHRALYAADVVATHYFTNWADFV